MNELIYDKFERYSKGVMSSSEKNAFESELSQDVDLRAEYNNYLIALEAIELEVARDLKQKFVQWRHAGSGRRGRIIPLALKLSAAAAITLVFFTAMLGVIQVRDLDRAIAEEMFDAYDNTSRAGGDSEIFPLYDQLELADILYTRGDFADALESYRSIQETSTSDTEIFQAAQFRECLAMYQLNGRHPAFEELLNVIADDDSHLYVRQARQLREKLNKTLVRLIKG